MSSEKTVSFKGTVIRNVYDSKDFKIYAIDVDKDKYPNVKLNKYKNASINGELPSLTEGVEYEITGVETVTKYGYSYKVTNIKRNIPTNEQDMYVFLQEILTPNQAYALWNVYPDIVQRIMNDNLNDIDLSKVHGIGKKTFDKIKKKVVENFKLVDLVAEFKGILSLSTIKRIYEKYESIELLRYKLKLEPYATLTKVSGIGFKTADSIILELQKENIIDFDYDVKTSVDRCLACITYVLQQNEDEGNTKMNLAELRKLCLQLVPECTDHFPDAINDDSIYYNKDNMDIARMVTYKTECYISQTILENVNSNENVWDFNVEKYRNIGEFELSDEQMQTLHNVCQHSICILNGFAGCVDCDTEFFNGYEWKKISEYENDDMVLQYNEDGTAELVYPLAYIKHPAEYLWHFETKYGLNQCLSDNHNCYYITSKGNLYHKTFKEVREDQERNGFHGSFITTFDYSGSGIDLSDDEIRLMIAVFADGSFYNNGPENETYKQARFHLKKERKKARLVGIINRLGLDYREADSATEGYTDYYVDVPFRAKHYPKEWYNCSKHQLEVIADEVMYWDGDYNKQNKYSTTNKSDADFIQFVYSAIGYRATISINDRTGQKYLTCGNMYTRKSIEYSVVYTDRTLIKMCTDKRESHNRTKIVPYKTKDGYEYCFTVPSSMLVLRRDDKIFITGNSGKSASTQALINMLEDNDKSYKLLAPTGKASKVIAEFTQRPASTIHRGLGYNPREGGWLFNKDCKLHEDVIVVDECSMVDVYLFYRVIDAIDFGTTKLLLIGDNAQLCSVGCGNILHDFMQSGIIPTTTLTKIFRYSDGGLMKAATDIRCSKPYLDNSMKSKATVFGNSKDYTFVDLASDNIPKNAVALYKKLLDAGNSIENIQVLTAKNVHECGAIELNNMLQQIANKNYGSDTYMKVGETTYYIGDLILQKANNYNATLVENENETAFVANGETGIIKDFDKKSGAAIIDFDGVFVKYYRDDMNTVSLGYAMSIHKSQGSSIENVIVCTPQSHTFMLNSNLLYVALTRTKKKCWHLGSIVTVNRAIHKKENFSRNTFMQQLLLNNN